MSEECRFERDAGPVRLAGLRAATLAELAAGLRDRWPGHGLVAADLSLGAWRPHQAATEVCEQLGLRLEPSPSAVPATGGAESVALLIDRETAGDATVRAALLAAARVRRCADGGASPLAVCVLAPRFGAAWVRADVLFVGFLARAFRGSPHRVIIATADPGPPPLPGGWAVSWAGPVPAAGGAEGARGPIALIPGIVPLADAADLMAAGGPWPALALPVGRALLGPELRPDPRPLPREAYDPLVRAVPRMPWLAAYAHFHAGDRCADRWRLYREACARFDTDAPRLLERCLALAAGEGERALFTAVAQGARIAAHDFAAAAAVADPVPAASLALRAFLEEAKGWALTMCDRPEDAEPHLAAARELLAGEPDAAARLFLLNISALNRLKLGDAPGALAFEREILSRRAGAGCQLAYVNALNLGRLHRRAGRLAVAERWLRVAFATADGVRSETDAVYFNATLGRLAEERGRRDDAFRAWLRAALHWAASPAPEAIGERAAAAAGGPGLDVAAGGPGLDAVAAGLLARLRETAAGADREALEAPGVAPTFARSDAAVRPDRAVLAGDVGVLAAPERLTPVPVTPAAEALRAGLAAVLGARDAAGGLAGAGTVLVDDRLGRELPATRAELAGAALRLGVRRLYADGTAIELAAAAGPVRLGPGVEAVKPRGEGAVVTFRRYRPPRVLSDQEAALVARVARGAPAGDAGTIVRRALERDRVLVVEDPA